MNGIFKLVFLLFVLLAFFPSGLSSGLLCHESPHKVYVILGFHANFYHSWRGDTPDEAGFGTDIRVVREVIRMLDEANEKGLDARGYWEGESLFTFEDIIPSHAPDIIEGIRRRIEAGLDEFMPAPYSNTMFSAITEVEMRRTVEWSVSNPWGSGAQDLFGDYVPLIRPQEGMATTGQIPILLEEGMEGMVLAYSTYPFTVFSNFTPPLPPEQRYGLTWMRTRDNGPGMILFPCVSAADVVNYISLEKWMLELRKMQNRGEVDSDLVIHINFDADAETWLPLMPPGLRWFPNGGGLPEYIKYVNKYEWAEFTVPSEFLAGHEPAGELVIRQDMADGGWDGNYSWAEKYPSHNIWSELEKSRLYTYRAEALMDCGSSSKRSEARRLLYEGRDSSLFERIRGLSTTHFGMSTPMVNEERQAVAEAVAGRARARAERAERMLADEAARSAGSRGDAVYTFLVRGVESESGAGDRAVQLVRIPVILERGGQGLALKDEKGNDVVFSLVNIEDMGKGRVAAEIMTLMELGKGDERKLSLYRTGRKEEGPHSASLVALDNGLVSVSLDEKSGISSLEVNGLEVGGDDFMSHFITYAKKKEPETFYAGGYGFKALTGERREGIQRARLETAVAFNTPDGVAEARIEVTLSLPDSVPWLVADVVVDYPYTKKEDVLHNMQQKLRRYLDLSWIEAAPFQLHPALEATREDPIKVWKHNYLDVTSWYPLDYGQINPQNAELDSFNHQVTAGWVAVTDRHKGLLISQSAERTSCYAFCPMRLRESEGRRQELWLNPFGSYHGEQMSYSHLGGNGLGTKISVLASAALRPNGPSYNGMKESFSLMLAPYQGDRPPKELTDSADAFFYPPAVVYVKTPARVEARLRQDVERIINKARLELAREKKGPLAKPLAFLANPTGGAVDVVWDEPPEDPRVDGYEIQWKPAEAEDWNSLPTGPVRRHRVDGLENGKEYSFRMRSLGMDQKSGWTETLDVKVGPVPTAGVLSSVQGVSPSIVLETLWYSNLHLLTTPPPWKSRFKEERF